MINMKANTGRRTQISERLTQNSLLSHSGLPPQGIKFPDRASYTDEFMATTAFLFPGQGSQFAGMGRSLAEQYPAARAVFAEADEALGFSLSQLCFEGPEEDLKKTENTQPALLTVSIAAYSVLAGEGVRADFVAGHSLGEYSALVAAGALRFADAVRLVRQRGRYMQEAVPQGVGAMAALLKLPEGTLEGILARAAEGEVVSAANLNSPDQVVIAGHAGAVERAMNLAKEAGAKRVVALPVSAPFHCALMQPAQARLAVDLAATTFADLAVPLVQNVTAEWTTSGEAAREGLIAQVPGTVRWTESMRRLLDAGVTRWVEVGAGGVLAGLLKNIDPNHKAARFGEAAEWEAVRAYLEA
jgi:[acyl-carrier-protein] S-malonyltransferase